MTKGAVLSENSAEPVRAWTSPNRPWTNRRRAPGRPGARVAPLAARVPLPWRARLPWRGERGASIFARHSGGGGDPGHPAPRTR